MWLKAAITALVEFIQSFVTEFLSRKNDVDSGAQDQRDAQDKADADAVTDAQATRAKTDALDDSAVRDGLNQWLRR